MCEDKVEENCVKLRTQLTLLSFLNTQAFENSGSTPDWYIYIVGSYLMLLCDSWVYVLCLLLGPFLCVDFSYFHAIIFVLSYYTLLSYI